MGCKFCAMDANFKKNSKEPLLAIEDIVETVSEALKEPGTSQSLFLTGGSLLLGTDPLKGGLETLDGELELYIEILRALGPLFGYQKFPSQLISTAFGQRQLRRLYDETGLMSYTADIEVLDEELFKWICPGKAKLIGYRGWKERLYEAAEIFGPGNVNSGIVSGVEMARPKGFPTEESALEATLGEAEDLARHGVWVVGCVWRVLGGSVFFAKKPRAWTTRLGWLRDWIGSGGRPTCRLTWTTTDVAGTTRTQISPGSSHRARALWLDP